MNNSRITTILTNALTGDPEAVEKLLSEPDLLRGANAFCSKLPRELSHEVLANSVREVLDGFVTGEYTQAFLQEMGVSESDFLEKGAGNLLLEGLNNPKFVDFLQKKFLKPEKKDIGSCGKAGNFGSRLGGSPQDNAQELSSHAGTYPSKEEGGKSDILFVFDALVTEKMRDRVQEQLGKGEDDLSHRDAASSPVSIEQVSSARWTGFKKIVLIMEEGVPYGCMSDALGWFNRFGGEIKAELRQQTIKLSKDDFGRLSMTDGSTFRKMCSVRQENELADDSLLFLLTATPNEGNWFLVNDPQSPENAFFHLDDYRWATSAPTKIVTAHFMMKAIFNAILQKSGIDYLDISHQKPRGCFFDFCYDKSELNLKMRTADICGDCMRELGKAGVSDSLLRQAVQLLEEARRSAVNTNIFMKKEERSESRFQSWPFPVAITRHKALSQREPRARFSSLEQHWLALVRYSFLANEVMAGKIPGIGDAENYYKPSAGWWEKQLKNASDGGAKRALWQAHGASVGSGIVEMRNHFAHRGLPDHEIRNLIPQMEEGIQKMEDCLEGFLSESHRLFFIEDMDLDQSAFSITGHELIGSHLIPPHFEDKLSTDAIADFKGKRKVYLYNRESKKLFDFSSFALRRKCPKCLIEDRLMMIESIPRGKRTYQDVYLNCRVHLPEDESSVT